MTFLNILEIIEPVHEAIIFFILIAISILLFLIFYRFIEKKLLTKIKRKNQRSSIIIFMNLIKYLFFLFLIIILLTAYYNSWGELGFFTGLLTIALGWALQKPISCIVAWIIIVVKKPFFIGDRIIVAGITGDLKNMTLTHLQLDEVGGTVQDEEKSRRSISIPNSTIFENEVINYTKSDKYILDEVTTAITYESNLEQAENIILRAAETILKPLWEKFPKKIDKNPHTRLKFKESGIDITVRYFSIAQQRNKIQSDITREIYNTISNVDEVNFAYPHIELIRR